MASAEPKKAARCRAASKSVLAIWHSGAAARQGAEMVVSQQYSSVGDSEVHTELVSK